MVFNDFLGNYKAISVVINAIITQKLKKIEKKYLKFLKKFTAFSIWFNVLWGNCKANRVVINALITQKLPKLEKILMIFKFFLQHSLLYLMTFETIIKKLGPLLTR